MNRQELKAEAQLAYEEWLHLLRTSLEYWLGLGRTGSLRSSSVLTRAFDKFDFAVRYMKGSVGDAQALFGEIYALMEKEFSTTPLRLIFQKLTHLARQSAEIRRKLTRILFRMVGAATNKNRTAFEDAVRDLVELIRSEVLPKI